MATVRRWGAAGQQSEVGLASPQFFTFLPVEVILSRRGYQWTMEWAWSEPCGSGF